MDHFGRSLKDCYLAMNQEPKYKIASVFHISSGILKATWELSLLIVLRCVCFQNKTFALWNPMGVRYS